MGHNAAADALRLSAGSQFDGRGKGRHVAVVGQMHLSSGRAQRQNKGAQFAQLGKLALIIQRGVFTHGLGLGRFTADDPIADDDVRETDADGFHLSARLHDPLACFADQGEDRLEDALRRGAGCRVPVIFLRIKKLALYRGGKLDVAAADVDADTAFFYCRGAEGQQPFVKVGRRFRFFFR